jgi:hypothetical protein
MKVVLFFISFLPMALIAQEQESLSGIAPSMSVFSLTAEEMVFASKLSDENRRRFCYQFSSKERLFCLSEKHAKSELSHDEIVCALEKTLLK